MTPQRHMSAWTLAASATAFALLVAGPAVVSPFVVPGVLFAHLVCALPFAAVVAGFVPRTPKWSVVGLTVAGLTISCGDAVGDALDLNDAGFAFRSVVRSAWCTMLAAPWFAAIGTTLPGRIRPLAITAAITLLVPASYVARVIEARSANLDEALRRGRADRSLALAESLRSLGRTTPLPTSPGSAASFKDDCDRIREEWMALRRTADATAPPTNNRDRTARGIALARLGRTEEAVVAFRAIADRDPDAELNLAVTLQSDENFDESDAIYRAVVDRALPIVREALAAPGTTFAPAVAAAADRLRRGYEGLAFNARMTKRYDVGASWYRQAQATLVGNEAYFEFQLGLHFAAADRPMVAATHFEAAARLAPREFGPSAARHLSLIYRDTPACLFRSVPRP